MVAMIELHYFKLNPELSLLNEMYLSPDNKEYFLPETGRQLGNNKAIGRSRPGLKPSSYG